MKTYLSFLVKNQINRLVYKNNPAMPEVPPEFKPPEEEKTLQDAYDEAAAELKKCEARIKKIDAFYKGKKMPGNVKKAYEAYAGKRNELKKYVAELKKKLKPEGKSDQPKISAGEEDIHKKTLRDVEDALAYFRTEYAGPKGDPEQGLDELDLEHVDVNPPPKTKKNNVGAPLYDATGEPKNGGSADKSASVPKRPEVIGSKELLKKNPDLYWRIMQRNVVKKILNHFATGEAPKFEKDEQTSVMFIEKGDSREVNVDGQKHTLERDKTGFYFRIRDYTKPYEGTAGEQKGGGKDMYIPYLAVFDAQGLPPIWPKTSELDYALEKMELNKVTLRKKVEWLFSPKAAPGARVSFDDLVQREKISDTEEKLTRREVIFVKRADGSVRMTETFMTYTRKGKSLALEKTRVNAPVVYPDVAACLAVIGQEVSSKAQVEAVASTAEAQKEEADSIEAIRQKEFESLASTLAVRASVLSQPVEPDRKDFMGKKRSSKKDPYYGTAYEVGAFDQPEEGKGPFNKAAYQATVAAYETDLAKYNANLRAAESKALAFLKKSPISFNKLFQDVQVRVKVKDGQLRVYGKLERGNDKRVARRYDIDSGIRIV
jgi:hypothetical protein